MYITIVISTLAISGTGLVALFLFRAWEVKQGRITREYEGEPIASRMYELRHTVKYIAEQAFWVSVKAIYAVWKYMARMIKQKTRAGSLHDIVTGKQNIEKGNGSSLYLKDISTHKRDMQNGKKEKPKETTSEKPE